MLDEGDDAESKIDHNNNLYGKALREKYPNRDDFIKKAIDNALLIGQGKAEEVNGRKGIKVCNNPVPEMQGPMIPPEQGGTALPLLLHLFLKICQSQTQ